MFAPGLNLARLRPDPSRARFPRSGVPAIEPQCISQLALPRNNHKPFEVSCAFRRESRSRGVKGLSSPRVNASGSKVKRSCRSLNSSTSRLPDSSLVTPAAARQSRLRGSWPLFLPRPPEIPTSPGPAGAKGPARRCLQSGCRWKKNSRSRTAHRWQL